MNLVKLMGGCFMVLGLAGMFLGSAMVPVSAPVWGDDTGGGTIASCTSHEACKAIVSPCTLSGAGCTAGGCDTSKQDCDGCECKKDGAVCQCQL